MYRHTMPPRSGLLALAFVMAIGSSASADAIYTYTGTPFQSVSANSPGFTPVFTTSQYLTITATFPGPLTPIPPGTYQFGITGTTTIPPGLFRAQASSFTMSVAGSPGVNFSLSSSGPFPPDPGPQFMTNELIFNSTGEVVGWSFNVQGHVFPDPPMPLWDLPESLYSENYFWKFNEYPGLPEPFDLAFTNFTVFPGPILPLFPERTVSSRGSTNVPGQWSPVQPFEFQAIPEPASVAVWSLLALAGCGFGLWKKGVRTQ